MKLRPRPDRMARESSRIPHVIAGRDPWPLASAQREDMVPTSMRPISFHVLWKPLCLGLLLAFLVHEVHASASGRVGGLVAWDDGFASYPAWVHPDAMRGVVAVEVTEFRTIAVKEDGRIVAWGSSRTDLSPLFAGLPPIAAIAGGGTILLSRDGRIFQRRWDDTDVALPFPADGFVAIAGGRHALALRDSGEVVCWGNNDYGQATVPAGLKDVHLAACVCPAGRHGSHIHAAQLIPCSLEAALPGFAAGLPCP